MEEGEARLRAATREILEALLPLTKSIGDNAIRQRSWRIPTRDRRSHAPAHRPLILFQNVATDTDTTPELQNINTYRRCFQWLLPRLSARAHPPRSAALVPRFGNRSTLSQGTPPCLVAAWLPTPCSTAHVGADAWGLERPDGCKDRDARSTPIPYCRNIHPCRFLASPKRCELAAN